MTQERMKSLEIGFGTERERHTHTHEKIAGCCCCKGKKRKESSFSSVGDGTRCSVFLYSVDKLLNGRASIIIHGLLEPSSEFHSCNKAVLDKRLVEGRESHC